MIDPRIPLMGQQQQDTFGNLAQGIQMGQGLRQLISGRQLGKMQQLAPEDRQAFADKSMFSRELNAGIKANNAAQVAQAMALQKHEADVYNAHAQGDERIANAGKTNQEANARRYELGSQVFQTVATGGLDRGKQFLNYQLATGAIDQSGFDALSGQLAEFEGKPLGEIQVGAFNQAKAMLDPKYSFQTQDNVADNLTSRENNEATVGATISGQVNQKEIADDKLELDKIIQQQKEARENGAFETMQGSDGITYAVYKSGPNAGKIEPLRIEGGEVFKQQSKTKLDSSALKQVNEYNSQLTQSKAGQVKIGGLLKDLQSGRLNLSPQAIIAAEGRARIGQSTPNDLAIGRFNTALNQAVNDLLMASKGTQTDGDAQRAAQVIRANPPRDNAAALQALQNLALITKTNIAALDTNLNTTYANFGMERPQVKAQTPKPPASTEQKAPSPKGSTMSSSEVKQAAQQAGISTEQAVQQLKAQGVVIK